jgi:ADP-ribosylglycohydrolase
MVQCTNTKYLDRFQGALIFGAVGDALGWPLEFSFHKVSNKERLENFISWSKLIGGRFWGYEERIEKGSYSDDTQLTLSVARLIDDDGVFNAQRFSFVELPLWLSYQRGGGTIVKLAARMILRKSVKNPIFNFFQQRSQESIIDYCNAGANGAAMRVLPIALVNSINNNKMKLLEECYANTLITYGHPRAILGTILYASLIRYLIQSNSFSKNDLFELVKESIKDAGEPFKKNLLLVKWIVNWIS